VDVDWPAPIKPLAGEPNKDASRESRPIQEQQEQTGRPLSAHSCFGAQRQSKRLDNSLAGSIGRPTVEQIRTSIISANARNHPLGAPINALNPIVIVAIVCLVRMGISGLARERDGRADGWMEAGLCLRVACCVKSIRLVGNQGARLAAWPAALSLGGGRLLICGHRMAQLVASAYKLQPGGPLHKSCPPDCVTVTGLASGRPANLIERKTSSLPEQPSRVELN